MGEASDAPHRRMKPQAYFSSAVNGSYCQTNWYEGHAGALGQPGHLPDFGARPAPALLGYDDGIFEMCTARVQGPSRASACRRDRPGHVARCCMAAGLNILNMVGHRVPYNLCRNLEWQLCALSGRLPSQPDGTIRFANAPRQLDVEPLARQEKPCAQSPSPSMGAKRRNGFSLPDIFHLEVCILNQVCTNGEGLFKLNAGEPFKCEFSHARFEALAEVLLAGGGDGCGVQRGI